jgi:hypothetical protein
VFLGEISSSKHYSKKEKSRFGRGLGPVVRQNTDDESNMLLTAEFQALAGVPYVFQVACIAG